MSLTVNGTKITNTFISKVIYGLVLFLAIVWFISLLFPAYLAAYGDALWAARLHHCFAALCHQIPSRSFTLYGHVVAVCARCMGIYGGLVLGILVYPCFRAYQDRELPARRYLLFALAPTAIDFSLGLLGVVNNTHFSRLLTGMIAGIALPFYLLPALVCLAQDLVLPRRAEAINTME
jgi:uncharacterized membrane protein